MDLKRNLPAPLKPEGDWEHIFSYHPMDVELVKAEGIYYFDTDGNKYIDASGGPMAFTLPHQALTQPCVPILSTLES